MTALALLPRQQAPTECGSRGIVSVPGRTAADRDLETHIERALLATGHRLFRTVTISVCGGAVTLRGQVPSYYLKQLAQSAVLAISGIVELHNELAVLGP